LGRLVGWDRGSWGWHADDGRSFEGQGRGEEFTEKWGSESSR
jgi:beta-catenin-like protein 1